MTLSLSLERFMITCPLLGIFSLILNPKAHEMFDSRTFSKDLKIQKANYLSKQAVDVLLIQQHIDRLERFDLASLKDEAKKKAFWINVYNGITNYVIITSKILNSMKEVDSIFRRKVFSISDMDFSLDDIEHGILRKNKRNMFSEKDPKLSLLVEQLDYRIHFALNCGARSCPLIAFYSASSIEQELGMAEDVFATNEFLIDHEAKKITCSQIFDWYREDFDGLFLDDPVYAGYAVSLKEYDWGI